MSSRPGWVEHVRVCEHVCVCLLTPCLSVKAWFIRLQIRANREGEPEQAWGWLFVYLPFTFVFSFTSPSSIHICHTEGEEEEENSAENHQLQVWKIFTQTKASLATPTGSDVEGHQESCNRVLKTLHNSNLIKQPWLSKQAFYLKPVWTVLSLLTHSCSTFSLCQHVRTEFTFTTSKL